MSAFRQIFSYLFNQATVDKLANSNAFQKAAFLTHGFLSKAATKTAQETQKIKTAASPHLQKATENLQDVAKNVPGETKKILKEFLNEFFKMDIKPKS